MFTPFTFRSNPTDADLINLYSAYSQDMYCAGWMSSPEELGDEFKAWLRAAYEESLNPVEPPLADYERDGLPVLRRFYDEALGDLLPPNSEENS